MAGFTSRDSIITSMTTNGKIDKWDFYKAGSTAQGAGTWHSLWPGAGTPGAGAAPGGSPGSGTQYYTDQNNATTGAIWFPNRSPDRRYLISFGCMATQNCTLMLYDRLVGYSGLSVASTGTRSTGGLGPIGGSNNDHAYLPGTGAVNNEIWLEVTTATTVTAPVVNVTYQGGVAFTSASLTGGNYTFPAAATVLNSMHQMPLDASTAGVGNFNDLTVVTAGNAGVVSALIIRPIVKIALTANIWNEVNFLDDILYVPRIYDHSTFALAFLASTTTAPNFVGSIVTAYG